jgi:hypothetical protein
VKRALELWQQSLALLEPVGDVQGKAATLHNMADVIAQQGDVQRALELWQQSLALLEQVGDVRGKATTLHIMAGVIARQGDVQRALELWQQSLALKEPVGDVQGKATTLASMAWLAGQQGDHQQARQLNLQSATALASVRAWLDLATVLGNLGTSQEQDGASFLAQAVWLAVRVEVPVDTAVSLAAALVEKLGPGSAEGPVLAAATAMVAAQRGQTHREREAIRGASRLLARTAEARGIAEESWQDWCRGERLFDRQHVFAELDRLLAGLVGESAWLFDRRLLDPCAGS